MPLGDRLALLQQDRELRAERKLRDMVTWKSRLVVTVTVRRRLLSFTNRVWSCRRKPRAPRREWCCLLPRRGPWTGRRSKMSRKTALSVSHVCFFLSCHRLCIHYVCFSLLQSWWISSTSQEDAAEAKEPHYQQVPKAAKEMCCHASLLMLFFSWCLLGIKKY